MALLYLFGSDPLVLDCMRNLPINIIIYTELRIQDDSPIVVLYILLHVGECRQELGVYELLDI